MSRIQVLPDSLINRIAAGEVVERPASVVKELVENSLDAGARSIEIDCEGGGRRKIRVTDDGCGMDRDDALLSIERHATSKLGRDGDLEAIATLGFRGEALSSIAAVSRFALRTATADGQGTEVLVHGGRIESVRDVALTRGTAIVVERLFFNVPARRKFLRTEATELGHIARLATRCALAHPRRRFSLIHGGRPLLHVDPVDGLAERIAQIYGREFARKLLAFEASVAGVRLHGFAGRPTDALPRRDGQHFFVNGRAVQDRVLLHALGQAYGNTMPRGRHPALFLFLDCEPGLVDVNVHPQKSEVRFRESSRIHDLTRAALQDALGAEAALPDLGDLRPAAASGEPAARVREAVARYLDRRGDAAPRGDAARAGGTPAVALPFVPAARALPATPVEARPAAHPLSRVQLLAQYRESYILAQDERGLLLVDQHAAHERVLFERYLEEAASNRVEVQQLLFPLTIELSPAERIVLEEELDEFRRLGFLIEPFGGNSVRLDGVPALGAELEPEALLRELLGQAARTKSSVAGAENLRHDLVTSAACQAAIKVNHSLERPAMARLLEDLFRTVNPSTCPHGRPLVFRLTHEEIERAFRRR